jgi:hypothetical protein
MPFPKLGMNTGHFSRHSYVPNGTRPFSRMQHCKGFAAIVSPKWEGLKTL